MKVIADGETILFSWSGSLVEVGDRIGSEIHFGFMGLPQISLQAGVGIYGTYTKSTREAETLTPLRNETVHLRTVFQDAPWSILTGNIAALDYLP
ncbi:hypothetical protein [Chondromyces crocatus]|uniref:Uncharacterized protein n=1 Tax=Chondromyces crocatus TaxID=52 RepID=A0A0K1EDG4_CHOCO|nr:hypothetical protein [Chondromyces crocatus]AKT38598.1 uncharacterized protein CMC5_027450 [Chondromyces crocatus]